MTIVSNEFATAIFKVLSTTGRNVSSRVPHYMILLSESTLRLLGTCKGGYTLVTLPRIVTPYRDSVDGTRDRVTYQKLVTR
jgi:hypothetical protein